MGIWTHTSYDVHGQNEYFGGRVILNADDLWEAPGFVALVSAAYCSMIVTKIEAHWGMDSQRFEHPRMLIKCSTGIDNTIRFTMYPPESHIEFVTQFVSTWQRKGELHIIDRSLTEQTINHSFLSDLTHARACMGAYGLVCV